MDKSELPYGFDLLHDIRTYHQLEARVKELTEELRDLENMCNDYMLAFPKAYKDQEVSCLPNSFLTTKGRFFLDSVSEGSAVYKTLKR